MTPKNILIIEDDRELCEELSESMEAAGHSVVTAPDPQSGDVLAKAGDFDSIILDYRPWVTRLDLLRGLVAASRAGIIVISGRPRAELRALEKTLSPRVSAVLEKPIDMDALLRLIQGPP